MKIIMSFDIIFYISMVFQLSDPHVITTFEEETLKKYFFLFENTFYGTFSRTENMYCRHSLYIFCHELRQARIFQIEGKETWVRESSNIGHEISKDLLEQEKNHTRMTGIRNKPVLRIGNTNISNLSSFNCMDHYGDYNWFITTGFVRDSAFLFTLSPNLNYVFSRETRGQTKKGEIIPKLVAIIDESAEIIPFRNNSFITYEDLLFHSVKRSDEMFDGEEKFCKIPPILQFRLCSIAADFISAGRLNRTELHNSLSTSSQTYRILSSNLYIEPSVPERACQFMELLIASDIMIKHEFLICAYNIENSIQVALLSSNLIITNTAFVGWITNPEQGDVNLKLFQAPLLLHLNEYTKIIKDEII